MWRGVACLLVVIFHSANCYVGTTPLKSRVLEQGGSFAEWLLAISAYFWVGVPMFFVISGYCISAAVVSAQRKNYSSRTFFYRRFKRIFPPLWIFLAITAACVALFPKSAIPGPIPGIEHPMPLPQDVPWQSWLGSITLTEEWRHYVAGPPSMYFLGHLWTLCYEEQFYAIAGLLLIVARKYFFAGAAMISFIIWGNLFLIQDWLYIPHMSGCFFDGMWLAFAAGIAMYYRVHIATPIMCRILECLAILVGIHFAKHLPNWHEFPAGHPAYIVVAVAFSLLLGWVHQWDERIAKARILGPVSWAGRMCYSLYLVHAPIVLTISWLLFQAGVTSAIGTLLITIPLGVAASLLVGSIFFNFVELRFLNTPAKQKPQ